MTPPPFARSIACLYPTSEGTPYLAVRPVSRRFALASSPAPALRYGGVMPDTIRHDDHDARHDADTNGDRRVSIREAAEILDVTSDAIRARLRRGTLRKETGPKGETVVVLDTDTTHPVGDTIQHDADTTQASADYVAAVEKQVEILRAELTERNRELSEMRRLLAGALDRIPALPPSEAGTPRDGSVTASETPTSAQAPQDDAGEPRAERSWWQRIFGT